MQRSLQAEASGVPGAATVAAIENLWPIYEAEGQEKALFEKETRELIAAHTKDIRSWQSARDWAGGFAMALVIVTFGLFVFLLLKTTPPNLTSLGSDSVRIAVIAGMLGIVFGLTALILKGAFTPSKRSDGPALMPESVKTLADVLGSLVTSHR